MVNSSFQSRIRFRLVAISASLLLSFVLPTIVGCKSETAVNNSQPHETTKEPTTPDAVASIDGLKPEDATLAKDRQEEIWAAEHATHVLEHRFGVRFKRLLKTGSAAELASLFLVDPKIELIDSQTRTATKVSSVTSSRSADGAQTAAANEHEFSKWLVELHRELGPDSKYSLRVLAIERQTSDDAKAADLPKEAWVADLLLTGTASYGEQGTKQVQSKHKAILQWDNIEQLEGSKCIESWNAKSVQVSEAPRKLMTEVTKISGLNRVPIQDNWNLPTGRPPQMISFQLAVEDYDRDGLLDIAVSSAGNNFLLKFDGNVFRRVTTAVGIHPTARGKHVDISAGWIDYDNDDDPDLILGGRVYQNESGKFIDVTDQSGIEFHPHHMGCAVADFDMDGFNDVYFIYSHDRKPGPNTSKGWIGDDESGGRNQLWRNNGDGTFTDATESAGVAGGKRQSFACTWLFADDDHYPDLYVANDFGTNSLFRNRGDGTFEDVSETAGVSDFATSMGVAAGDLDNDGTSEIYVANMYSKMGRRIVGQIRPSDYPAGVYPRLQGACAGSRLYRLGTSTQQPASEFSLDAGVNKVGWAYAPAMADFNNDGLLDMYATCGFISVDRSKPDG